MSNESIDMQRYIQAQQKALENDPNFPLNDFNRNMKVGNIPTGAEREQLERDVMETARRFHNVQSDATVLNERDKASPEMRQKALNRQRQLVNQLRSNNSRSKAPTSQKDATQHANHMFQNIVAPEERSVIQQGRQELGYVDDGRGSVNDPGEYTSSDIEDENTQTPNLPLPNGDEEESYEICD